MCKNAKDKDDVVAAIPMACADEKAAVEFMEAQRWGDRPCCVHCGSVDVYKMTDRKTGERNNRYLWRCHDCKKQYTVRIGTVFEDSRIPLKHWCYAFWRACTSKKGVSALEIKRQTGLSYKSALFMLHRVRYAMQPVNESEEKLNGTVEVDETYVGGKPRYKGRKPGRRTDKEYQKVVALVERDGNVKTKHVADVTASTLKDAIRANVEKSARIMTDEFRSYHGIGTEFLGGHHTVNHGRNEYVRGDIHTNTVEGFFSIVKRGLNGIYHNVSKEHLFRYLNEFEFRYNRRHMTDGERTVAAIKGSVGKKLFYKQPIQ